MNAPGTCPFALSVHSGLRRGLAAATALGLVLGSTGAGQAATYSTSPGKNSAYEASTGNVLTTLAPKLTATIAKGKKKTVLAIEATYTDAAYYPTPSTMRVLGMYIIVNGLGVQPNPFTSYQHIADCGFVDTPTIGCTVTGTFWLDIDAAELANPGVFVGQPLSIVLSAGDLAAGGLVGIQPMDATMTVRVEKK